MLNKTHKGFLETFKEGCLALYEKQWNEEILMTKDQHIAVYVGVWVARKGGVLSGIDRLNLQREINAFLMQRGECLTAAGCSLLDQMVNSAIQVVLAKKDY